MNTIEHIQYIKELKNLTQELLKSKEKSQDFFISAGILTKNGTLSSIYKNNDNIKKNRTKISNISK